MELLEPGRIQLLDLGRGVNHHVQQHFRSQSELLEDHLYPLCDLLGESGELRASVCSLRPSERWLFLGESEREQLNRSIQDCYFCGKPLLGSYLPDEGVGLAEVEPLRLVSKLLWSFFCAGRSVLHFCEDFDLVLSVCLAELEKHLFWYVSNAPGLLLEVFLVLGVGLLEAPLQTADLLLQFLIERVPAPFGLLLGLAEAGGESLSIPAGEEPRACGPARRECQIFSSGQHAIRLIKFKSPELYYFLRCWGRRGRKWA